MKKKVAIGVIAAAAIALLAVAAVWGKQYYDKRYVGEEYYAMVPLDSIITPVPQKDMNGGDAGVLGFAYSLTAYNEQGEARQVEFTVTGDDLSKYPQPGAFLLIKASDTIVVGWSYASESEVPHNALDRIK